MSDSISIGFLGAGKMATALAKGLVSRKVVDPKNLIASDLFAPARQQFSTETGGKSVEANTEVLASSNVIILAVKPQQAGEVLEGIASSWTSEHLLVSIAAGVSIAKLESHLPDGARVIRVMPNTPALVGESASAFAVGAGCKPEDGQLVMKLLAAVGLAFEVKEPLLDAVTGLSGSGPAYVYQFIEALSDGGVASGLPRDTATKLAAQTVLGAAKMVLVTGQHPGVLKDMVTSPGGTTIDGIHELEVGGLRGTVMNAVRAATEKSKELGRA